MAIDYENAILDVAQKHGRYKPNAYRFTLDAVHHTVGHLKEIRHVSGGELLGGIRELAVARGYDFDEAFVRNFDWLDRISPKRRDALD